MFEIVLLLLSPICIVAEIVNINVEQTIDIKTHLIKIQSEVLFVNYLSDDVVDYHYTIEPYIEHYFVQFFNQNFTKLKHIKDDNANKYTVLLDTPVGHNRTGFIVAEIVQIDQFKACYKTRRLYEDQVFIYSGNVHFYSPYKTEIIETRFVTKEWSVMEIYLDRKFVNDGLIFTFTNVPARSVKAIRFELKINDPIFGVNLERTIDVSHFGEILVEDSVVVINEGSKFVGPYEPENYQPPIAAANWLYTHLPASAYRIKFFDEIGNNSQSRLLNKRDYITLKFKTRYPLLGGWRSKYVLQYSLPAYEYLSQGKHNYFSLKMRVIDHVLSDCVIKTALVRVLLPEGSSQVQTKLPRDFVRSNDEITVTSLCVSGRPVVVFKGDMLLENNIADFTIVYMYDIFLMLQTPLVITFYIHLLFVLVILYMGVFK